MVCGIGQFESYRTVTCHLGAMGNETPRTHRCIAEGGGGVETLLPTAILLLGSGQWNLCHTPLHCSRESPMEPFNAFPQCLVMWGSGTCVAHCHSAQQHSVVDLLPHTASLPGGSRRGTDALHQGIVWARSAVELVHYIDALPRGSGWQRNSSITPPNSLVALCGGTCARHCNRV